MNSSRSSRETWIGFAAIWIWVHALPSHLPAQSADWKDVVYREPQVRYLIADIQLGGNPDLYRKYAAEGDPDSRKAIQLWDTGARIINTNDFERRWVTNKHGKDGRVMRIVHRGTESTISGNEVLLSSDLKFQQGPMRAVIADLSLGRPLSFYMRYVGDPNVAEAVARWKDGARTVNTNLFEISASGRRRQVIYRGTTNAIDGTKVILNSDFAYPETNVRYFLADMFLGGSVEFYRAAAERDHEMGCLEAVRRCEQGYRITNLADFERKTVDGKTIIARKGSNQRIGGMEVQLSSDLAP